MSLATPGQEAFECYVSAMKQYEPRTEQKNWHELTTYEQAAWECVAEDRQ